MSEEGPDDLEPADGDTQMEYSSDQLYTPNIRPETKMYL